MKAEHRKELHTNILADRLGKLYQRVQTSSGAIWWVLLGMVVLGVGFYWYTTRTTATLTSAWVSYWNSRTSVLEAEDVLQKHKGTAVEAVFQLAKGDQLYEDAFNTFFSMPAEARKKFGDAATTYENLSNHAGGNADLAVRALLGAGKCQEWLGEQARAKYFYDEVVNRYPTHPLTAQAKNQLDRLAGGEAFYKDWPNRLPEITRGGLQAPTPPALPGAGK